MGSVGDCYDNALCESFFASLECELLDRRSFQTHAEARMAVFQYIEGWYNTHRRHSSIGYYAPIAFERRYTSSIQHVEPLTVHQIGATPLLVSSIHSDKKAEKPVPAMSTRQADAHVMAEGYFSQAWRLLGEGLGPYVFERTGDQALRGTRDVYAILQKMMARGNWDQFFTSLGRNERNWASELFGLRNDSWGSSGNLQRRRYSSLCWRHGTPAQISGG